MVILYLLIPISLLMITAAIFAFRWAIKNRQYDDLQTPSMIPLLDDEPIKKEQKDENNG